MIAIHLNDVGIWFFVYSHTKKKVNLRRDINVEVMMGCLPLDFPTYAALSKVTTPFGKPIQSWKFRVACKK